uniref:Serine protease easter-like n=1 Tax=Drosophila rhopaloa TaxID=1041015 RepID=A0A6P4E523_DRORH
KVRLGEYDMSTNPDCSSMGCEPPSFEIDIERLIPTHHHIRPICLLVNQSVVRTFTSFNVTGWGKTKTSEISKKLQTATLHNLDNAICGPIFGIRMSESEICAGSWTSNTCIGDTGGPLTAQLVYGKIHRVFQFGITSFGMERCRGVGVYTNVTHYINWIQNTVNEDFVIRFS